MDNAVSRYIAKVWKHVNFEVNGVLIDWYVNKQKLNLGYVRIF